MKINRADFNTYIHQIKRAELKMVKLTGSEQIQAMNLVRISNKISIGAHNTGDPTDFSVTLIDNVKKRVNII